MITIALALALAPATVVDGEFRISDRTDEIADTSEIFAVVGSQDRHLAVGCDLSAGQGLRIVFEPGRYLGEARRGLLAGGREFTYRFDRNEPVADYWGYEDRRVIEERRGAVSRFVEQLKGSRTLFIRATTSTSEELDFRFDYPDPTAIVEEVERRCATAE